MNRLIKNNKNAPILVTTDDQMQYYTAENNSSKEKLDQHTNLNLKKQSSSA